MNDAECQNCIIYRCGKQSEAYVFLRGDLDPNDLPEALLKRTGSLIQVMTLNLVPDRKLARADSRVVIESLARDGFYLQLPPKGLLDVRLYWGD